LLIYSFAIRPRKPSRTWRSRDSFGNKYHLFLQTLTSDSTLSFAEFIASLSQREVWRECQYGCPKGTKKRGDISHLFFWYLSVTDYRTFIDDYLKIVEFIEWLKVAYPEKAKFLTKKS
jgi:hypothetical protein